MDNYSTSRQPIDALLIGAGIMSATLAVMLKELMPELKIEIHETLSSAAQESSNAWNNAGTGHAALCEMNYTPEKADGSIDISQALKVNGEFDISRQFWAYLVKKGSIKNPQDFIHPVPHMSLVMDPKNIAFLKKRFSALTAHPCYKGMEYTDDMNQINEWAPLITEGRDKQDTLAMTRMSIGTDVDYGSLTTLLISSLKSDSDFHAHFLSEVTDLKQEKNLWRVTVYDKKTKQTRDVLTRFVFIGAGGAALKLLEQSKIPEANQYAGYPVSGIWLRCDKQTIANKHDAKVYGKASSGSPPMSVPHLDRRHINGKLSLLFGPFAGFSTKFLKHGSYLDFFRTINFHNIFPMLDVGRDNMALTEYLIGQILESSDERLAALQQFYPEAKHADWTTAVAGQRVQIIEKDPVHGGVLQFGTKLVKSADGSIIAMLGASPGASTATSIMIHVLEACFADKLKVPHILAKLKNLVPSYGQSLSDNAKLCQRVRDETAAVLNINKIDTSYK